MPTLAPRRREADRLRRRPARRRGRADAHGRRRRHARLHGARAGGGATRRRARRPLRARARPLRGARRGEPGQRRLAVRDRAAHRHPAAAAREGAAPDLPGELCAALDRALRPDPELRGDLDDLFDALRRRARARCPTRAAGSPPHPLERTIPALPPAVGRLLAPAAAGALAWAALAGLTPEPAVPAPAAAVVAALLVALLPRAGWLIAAAGITRRADARPAPAPRRGAARRRARGRARRCCCAPTAAPGRCRSRRRSLGLVGLAGAYPALAGRAPRWTARARARRARRLVASCSPSRCSAARWSSGRPTGRRSAPGSTARPGSPPAT